jgi:hypothetical protein
MGAVAMMGVVWCVFGFWLFLVLFIESMASTVG